MEEERTIVRVEAKTYEEAAVELVNAMALLARNGEGVTGIEMTLTVTKEQKPGSELGKRATTFIKEHKKELLQILYRT